MRWYAIDPETEYGSVTTVLGWAFRYGDWFRYDLTSPEVLTARSRGRAVHKAAYWMAIGRRLNPQTVDPMIEPHVAQFNHFLSTTKFETEEAEFPIVSRTFRFAGRGDLRGRFPGDPSKHLIDVKSGLTVLMWLAGFQTAAYLRGYREMTGDLSATKRSVLHLNGKKPDQWRLKKLDDPDDWTMFLSANNCFNRARIERCL